MYVCNKYVCVCVCDYDGNVQAGSYTIYAVCDYFQGDTNRAKMKITEAFGFSVNFTTEKWCTFTVSKRPAKS